MDSSRDGKRKKDKHSEDDDGRRDKKSKRARSRSRSPDGNRDRDSRRKRRYSKSRSPPASVKKERTDNSRKESEVRKDVPERKAKDTDMLNTRTGGAYIPPARLRMMQAQITDKSSVAYQRLAWEALKKSIHGHINKINVGNIGIIIKELLKENIVRGRGLLCRSVIQAQAASPTFTNVYAALVAAVNSRFPNIGELLLKRLVIQFKRGFKRNDKAICISSASFIAHLVNQRVAHEILALELLTLLVETPTDDSVEVAIAFLKECGQKLTEVSSKGVNAIFEMLRNILHEGQLDKRVQYMIEVMFQVWKDGFKDHPALIEELELVPEEEQFTHLLMLDDATDPQDILNVFKFDDKYEENEQKYKTLSKEILGSDAESGDEDGSGESGSEEEEEEEEEAGEQKGVTIIDNTETNLVALRRTIYLTINSSLDFEECAHKLMKMQLKPGQEVELCHMFLDCCAEQRTYEKFYGLLAQRFCNINRIYIGPFEEIFKDSYSTAHRLDTNRLRNVSKFFAHLLFTDSISWEVLECVRLNEEDTTSSSRIYIKILFQELAEYMGLKKLNDRLKDPTLQEAFSGIFPRDNPKNTRFSINFFTSIGLGGLTDELREHLKQMPKNVPAPITEINLGDDSSSDSSSSSSDSSSSSSDSSSSDSESSSSSSSEEEKSKKKKKKSKPKKAKNKTPKTPEEDESNKNKGERWGHDGFYDTYGKDARRNESDRRDRDHFVAPREPRRNDKYYRNEERNGDARRRDDRRIEQDDSRNRNRRDEHFDRERNDKYERARRDRYDDVENEKTRTEKESRREKEKDISRKMQMDNNGRKDNAFSSDDDRSGRRGEYRDKERNGKDERGRRDRYDNFDAGKSRIDKGNRREKDMENNITKHKENYRRKESDSNSDDDRSGRRDERRDKERNGKDERKRRDRQDDCDYEKTRIEKEKRREKEKDASKKKQRKNKESSESDSSSDEDRSSRRKDKTKYNRKDRNEDRSNVSTDEVEESRSRRDDKKRNRDIDREDRRQGSGKNDEWETRENSVKRDIPGRYWETYSSKNIDHTEEDRPEKSRDKKREHKIS